MVVINQKKKKAYNHRSNIQGFVRRCMWGDVGYSCLRQDLDPETHAYDQDKYFQLEGG